MKERIEQALGALIGLPLSNAGRTADLEWLHFGACHTVNDRHGQPKEVGEYALHVQCAWRLAGPDGIIVASRDRFYPSGDPKQEPSDFEWNKPGANRCDERMAAFVKTRSQAPLLVETVQVDSLGGCRLLFGDGYVFEIFPDDSLGDEFWRLFQPGIQTDHFVVTGQGIEE